MQDEMSRDAAQRMGKCVALLKEHYRKMRTGRANVGLVDGLKVEYYGTEMPISQVATISVEDARTMLKVGQQVEAKFTGVDRKSRAIMLSIKAKEMHEETQAVQSYKAEGAAGTRLGDLLKEHMPGQDDA